MESATARILRGNDITVKGSVKLGQPAPQVIPSQAAHNTTAQPNVMIVNNTADFAILEVTCPCGHRTQIKCEYAKNT